MGGRLNVAYNCVDRHVEASNGDRVAIHWKGELVGDSRTLTYSELLGEVCKAPPSTTGRTKVRPKDDSCRPATTVTSPPQFCR